MDFNADMAGLARRYPNLWRSVDLIRAQGQQRFSECEWPPDVFLTDEAISAIMHGTASAIPGVDQWPDDMSRIHAGPRPHVRRAHWHGFWSGPRKSEKQRTFSVQWLPPIAVAMVDVSSRVNWNFRHES